MKGRIYLTERDLKLLESLCNYGVLTTKQIQSLLFSAIEITTVLRRLRKLRERGYIQMVHGLKHGHHTWFNTLKGAKEVGSEISIGGINRNTLVHDILINDVRMRLESAGVYGKWLPGYILKQRYEKRWHHKDGDNFIISDSLWISQSLDESTEQKIYLELELTLKSKKRYEEVFSIYRAQHDAFRVWYLVPNQRLGEKLQSLWDEQVGGRTLWGYFVWSLIDDVLSTPLETVLHSKHEIQKLKEIVRINPINPAHPDAHRVGKVVDNDQNSKVHNLSENSQEFQKQIEP